LLVVDIHDLETKWAAVTLFSDGSDYTFGLVGRSSPGTLSG
jgi:hypothetical protein